MVKETAMSAKTCSQCGLSGHNARTCVNADNKPSVKLFGVNISEPRPEETALRKSQSLGNLQFHAGNSVADGEDHGYLSDDLIVYKKRKTTHKKRKGTPWTEEEHRTFLSGLKKLGKGNWRGISKKFVVTRTPTQVASHAQKYFQRLNINIGRKRRGSLFDIPFDHDAEENSAEPASTDAPAPEASSTFSSVKPPVLPREPVHDLAQFKILNPCLKLNMQYPPIYQTLPLQSSLPFILLPQIHQTRAVPVQMVHPSGIPAPRQIPTAMTPSQTGNDWGLELQLATRHLEQCPRSPRAIYVS